MRAYLLALSVAACTPDTSAAPISPIVWESLNTLAPSALVEAPEAPNTDALYRAAVKWLDRPELAPLDDVRRFAAIVAGETDLATGLVVVSIAVFESQFAADVGDGRRRGDDGAACGYCQLHLDIQRRPGDPSCSVATQDMRAYVRVVLRWLQTTPTAWGNIGWHRQRAAACR
jgi:hypothetical protein